MLISASLDPIAILNSAKVRDKKGGLLNPELYQCAFVQDVPSDLSKKDSNRVHEYGLGPGPGSLPGHPLKLFRSTAPGAVEITGRYSREGGAL